MVLQLSVPGGTGAEAIVNVDVEIENSRRDYDTDSRIR